MKKKNEKYTCNYVQHENGLSFFSPNLPQRNSSNMEASILLFLPICAFTTPLRAIEYTLGVYQSEPFKAISVM
jgi:hypothetical protein